VGPSSGEFWTIEPRDGVDRWQEMLSSTHLPWTVAAPPRDGQPFEASARRRWLDDLALVDCRCGPCSGARQRREIGETEGDFVVVLITRSGRETVSQDGADRVLGPGDAIAWDSTRPARFRVWEALSKRSLLIPRAALDEVGDPSRGSTGLALDASAPATRLLTGYVDTLSHVLPGLTAAAVSAARNATLELFLGAVRSGSRVPATGTTYPALRAAMDRHIAAHLLSDSLTSAALASAHGVSVRTVNRVFQATGETVSEVIRLRRLARARTALVTGRDSIATIAARCRFADSSHFSRMFRAQYGSSPGDYRARAVAEGRLAGADVHDLGAPVHAIGPRNHESSVVRSGC
jgi:AraC family transcriptional activator of tynA and feaB